MLQFLCLDSRSRIIASGPGQIQLNLPINHQSVLRIWRPPQRDMAAAIASNLAPLDLQAGLKEFLASLARNSTQRQYDFSNQQDLHIFQKALTGFDVVFDGTATSFLISRGRGPMLLGKRWDGRMTRIQLLKNPAKGNPVYQVVAFFSDTSHGHAMNFALKSTDVFETTNAKSKHTLKLVDAKFALPKQEADDLKEFVCVDNPEWPSEHGDIVMTFENVEERDNLVKTVPSEAKDVTNRLTGLRLGK